MHSRDHDHSCSCSHTHSHNHTDTCSHSHTKSNTNSAPIASVHALIFDCADPLELAYFYAKLLGGEVEADPFGAYILTPPGRGIELGFQMDEDYIPPVWPGKPGDQLQMLHLDLRVENAQKAQEYALSIGATMPPGQFCQPDWDVQWVTLLDPAGHPFCLWDE